ncbi:hypothetical protein ACPXBS_26420, partial [Escherichia coli]|uniref:hypothetical protein n=1 Tax=Escherichia coli TaxID=562 RepID=UPI003CE4CB4C
MSKNFPSLVQALSCYDKEYVFDGEVVALDKNGRPSFQHLQQSSGGLGNFGAAKNSGVSITFYVFDILFA